MHGFDFLTKNFNNKVHNYFIKTASWLDTTANVAASLRYEQTLFDLCEVYTRQFRKSLRENRKKIASGLAFVNNLNAEAMAGFSSRRIAYDSETKFGTDPEQQERWARIIKTELAGLKDFAIEE